MEDIEGDDWVSPVSYDAESMASTLREVLKELNIKFERDQSQKSYSKFTVIIPMMQFAHVYRFNIKTINAVFDFYDTRPTHAGIIPFIEIHGVRDDNFEQIKLILEKIVGKLPEKPWVFSFKKRIGHALWSPDYGKAKRAWRKFGFG